MKKVIRPPSTSLHVIYLVRFPLPQSSISLRPVSPPLLGPTLLFYACWIFCFNFQEAVHLFVSLLCFIRANVKAREI